MVLGSKVTSSLVDIDGFTRGGGIRDMASSVLSYCAVNSALLITFGKTQNMSYFLK